MIYIAREFAQKFYKSKAWLRCREAFLSSKYYLCERCGGAATIAHHIIYLTPGNIDLPEITLNWDNLKAVCHNCHNIEHGGSVTAEGLEFDKEGNLVQVVPPDSNI